MAQDPAGLTIKNENAGVNQNENAGVHQNASMNSPQSGHNDPQNYPTLKPENMIDETGNRNEAKMRIEMTLKMRTKMDMRTQMSTKVNRRT